MHLEKSFHLDVTVTKGPVGRFFLSRHSLAQKLNYVTIETVSPPLLSGIYPLFFSSTEQSERVLRGHKTPGALLFQPP